MQTRHRWIGALGHGKFSCIRYLLGRHVINLQRWWLDWQALENVRTHVPMGPLASSLFSHNLTIDASQNIYTCRKTGGGSSLWQKWNPKCRHNGSHEVTFGHPKPQGLAMTWNEAWSPSIPWRGHNYRRSLMDTKWPTSQKVKSDLDSCMY